VSLGRASVRELRRFGIVVGVVFLLISSWWIHRHKFAVVSVAFAVAGASLLLFAAISPRALTAVHRGWLAIAEGMSFVMTRVILAVIFFAVVTPIGLVRRLAGGDPLRRRSGASATYWETYPSRQQDSAHFEKMF
jgi:Saxitoxin biosynthesis operon protein SxtJ